MTIFSPPTLHDGFRWKNMKIGLVGGSFNPPHEGHIHISKIAKQKLDLDVVWWLVTTQNPLKKIKTSDNYEKRIKECQKLTKKNIIL